MSTNNTDQTRKFLSTTQASEFLSISPRTLERSRLDGDGPPYTKLGRLCRYSIDELEAWAAAGRRISTSDPGPAPRPEAA
ncbi:unnamed protein product [marine sediment metagenome]|uniref:Helix-turn-helix domain-containing protein n=1 Tax=marine sediment metagenome TaxID=412755 RepID=X0X105_9ZZZZ